MLPTDVELFPPVPADTANAALLVIRNGNFYLSVGRLANSLFVGSNLTDQADELHLSNLALARLYLTTIFQFTESLADKQAAGALQKRVDWKYALHLPLNYSGVRENEFCIFRKWLMNNQYGRRVLQSLLERLCEITQAESKPPLTRPKSDVLYQICLNNRLAIVWEAINATLNVLAAQQPGWLEQVYQPHWYQRYTKSYPALKFSLETAERVRTIQAIGNDGLYLLEKVAASGTPEIQKLPEISALRKVWEDQYYQAGSKVFWRDEKCINCPNPAQLNNLNANR
jgi:transposase